MALGVYLSFRILNYADLTVDGSFTLGASVAARLITASVNPWLGIGVAALGGAMAGGLTGWLNTRLKIEPLLAGILSMTALYSINLRVMGRSNIGIPLDQTAFSQVAAAGVPPAWATSVLGVIFLGSLAGATYWFLRTELGLAVRATGDNPQMIRTLGVNTDHMKMLGLALSNALVAVSGALVAQYQGFSDAGMGIGMIVVGLASVIIGEMLVGRGALGWALASVAVGSVLYRLVIALALQVGAAPTDLKLVTAMLVALALWLPSVRTQMAGRIAASSGRREHDQAGRVAQSLLSGHRE